jgi:hypothetical protein
MDADGENLQAAGVTAYPKLEFGDTRRDRKSEIEIHAGIDRVNAFGSDLPLCLHGRLRE